ncbi:hypothetical protein SDC9_128161 [bioreactor metagenome]|uniref:Uncharacterized protein n=1 Tax=bioreactor metagenome TaxID=1076179 RepID=A0A645CW24_9ZZZZ
MPFIFNGEDCFYTPVQIAAHQVGTAQVDLLMAVIFKVKDATVFQKPPNHAHHADVFAQSLNTRYQATNAAHQQVDLHPCLGGLVEELDHLCVHHRIYFDDDVPFFAVVHMLHLPANKLFQLLTHVHRRY